MIIMIIIIIKLLTILNLPEIQILLLIYISFKCKKVNINNFNNAPKKVSKELSKNCFYEFEWNSETMARLFSKFQPNGKKLMIWIL